MSVAETRVYRLLCRPGELEPVLLRTFPLVQALLRDTEPDVLAWFARYRDELLLGAIGLGDRPQLSQALDALMESWRTQAWLLALEQQPDPAEYGTFAGPRGLLLAQRFFALDSSAVCELIAAQQRAEIADVRRPYALLFADCLLDLAACSRDERVRSYQIGWEWAVNDGSWTQSDIDTLTERAESQRAGLAKLLGADRQSAWEQQLGSPAAAIGQRLLDTSRPIVQAIMSLPRDGEYAADPIAILWSLLHRQCNRLGIPGLGEAVLRYFAFHWMQHEPPR